MAVLGMREPCVNAVAEPLTLCLPPHTASLSLEGGGSWPEVACAGISEAVVASPASSRNHPNTGSLLLWTRNKCKDPCSQAILREVNTKITSQIALLSLSSKLCFVHVNYIKTEQ